MSQPEKQREPIKAAPTFKDGADRVWCINPTLGLIDNVMANTQVDLLPEDNDPTAITGLLFNPRKLGGVLWEFCQEQAVTKGVDRKAFLDGFDGAAISRGWGALVDGIYFFIQSQSGQVANQWMALVEAAMKVVEAGAVEVIGAINCAETDEATKRAVADIGKDLRREIHEALGKFATNSAESPTSIRDRFRSAS